MFACFFVKFDKCTLYRHSSEREECMELNMQTTAWEWDVIYAFSNMPTSASLIEGYLFSDTSSLRGK